MPKGAGWAEQITDRIGRKRGEHERARGRDIRDELDYTAIQDEVGVAGLVRSGYGWKSVEDQAMSIIYEQQGFHGKPEVLTEAEMDQRIASGWIEVWRGFGAPSEGGTEYAEQFRTGDRHYAGLGVRANGTYTALARHQAVTYTAAIPGMTYLEDDHEKALVRMAIPPDARIEDEFNMAYVQEIRGDHGIRDPLRAARGRVLSDDGRLAAAMGFDALVGRGVYVIFNRSMLAVQEAAGD